MLKMIYVVNLESSVILQIQKELPNCIFPFNFFFPFIIPNLIQ